MSRNHLFKSTIILGVFFVFLISKSAFAANAQVKFDPTIGKLSVSGVCSGRFVLLVIRHASDNSIWASSNPSCTNGSYAYDLKVPSDERNGGAFVIDVTDVSSASATDAGAGAAGTNATGTAPKGGKLSAPAGAAAATVTFSAPDITTVNGIAIDTSSLATAPNDGSFLDSILQPFLGIVNAAVDAVKASVVAAENVLAKIFTVLPGGSIAVPRGNNQMAGTGYFNPGALQVFVPNTLVTSSSQVIVTPTTATDAPLAVTQKNDGLGFYVTLARAQMTQVSFSWLIVNTYAASAPAETQPVVTQDTANSSGSSVVLDGGPSIVPDTTSTIPDATSTITEATSTADADATVTDATTTDQVATTTDLGSAEDAASTNTSKVQ